MERDLSRRGLLKGAAAAAGAFALEATGVTRVFAGTRTPEMRANTLANAEIGEDGVFPVKPGSIYWRGDPSLPYVFITIDDLASNTQFERSLNIAKQHGVKFTYYPVGDYLNGSHTSRAERRRLLRRAHAEGHGIGIHTRSHLHLPDLTLDEKVNQILKGHMDIQNALQKPFHPVDVRPPYGDGAIQGAVDPEVKQAAALLNLGIAMWDRDSKGYAGATREQVIANCMPLENGTNILLHANGSSVADIDALPELIQRARNAGLQLKTHKAGIPRQETGL